MGLSSLLEQRSSLSNPDRWLIRMMGGDPVSSGVDVDEDAALTVSAILCGVRILCETYGSVPVKYYERTDAGRREVRTHQTWRLLHEEPNEEQTPMEFGEMVMGFAVLAGTGYAEIVRDGNGRGVEMWPIPSYRVTPERRNERLVYKITGKDGERDRFIPHEDMFALRGFSRDGVSGLHTVEKMREPIGLAMALDRYAGRFFGNGAQPGGFLKHPNRLGPDSRKNIRESWERAHKGVDKAHRVALLEEGLEWVQTQSDPEKSQLLPLRKYSTVEAARILNMPPHMLKDLERATFSNIEHQSIEFVTYTMRPWFVRASQALEKKLILPSQRGRFYIEHTIEALLVGDIKTQMEAFAIARQNGLLNANEIRAKMNQNSYDGGDEYLVQVNMIPARQLPALYEPDDDGDVEEDARSLIRRNLSRSCTPLFNDALSRIVRAETGGIRKALRKSNGGRDEVAFRTAVDSFYADHGPFVERALSPAAQTFADIIAEDRSTEALVQEYVTREGAAGAADRLAELREVIADPEDAEGAVTRLLGKWEADSSRWARREMDAIADAVDQLLQGRAA